MEAQILRLSFFRLCMRNDFDRNVLLCVCPSSCQKKFLV